MIRKDKSIRLVIAGGGTGGHVFPAVAVAQELLARKNGSEVLFIGTHKGLEARILPEMGFEFRTIDIEGIKGKGLLKRLKGAGKIPKSMIQSCRIIHFFKPDVVFGVGGYASGPAVMAAFLMGIPTAVAEQNAVPGITNRILGKVAKKIFITFEDRQGYFPENKIVHTGNPVREEFIRKEKKVNGPGEDKFTILIFGGSQGASSINRAFADALSYLEDLQGRLQIIHQTGEKEWLEIAREYREKGWSAEVYPFINDMVSVYARANLLVCRAGATSIAEITASGKAAVLIPYPYSAGGHQIMNAKMLVDSGAAEMIIEENLTGELLASQVRGLLDDRAKLKNMGEQSKKLGKPDASKRIIDELMALAA
ncbi:MAG: undecaprenyldiphospho-muramoylpentapeptide beta-N-acetylglucosaminyltransferase [Syntrophales bacterium]|jgi:UDP-N-acetylglucosamine--N-acetylmuramyl-(pentapeptide) pyrophosphoryl-undecaprenol N-acetylglucosamine transferase|nr:undecaprenyldiphospho-muramoylpentapeptide beta-N-acetylglucosaminyltransferase [Syntrophales bacterium]MDY0043055.1 undecaprenyldiphospho-muramoylpentapeptide beta-N-acetylglucosaminyltransferase [Syntrophales bacterium]